jgi:hypothetical protein
MAITGGRTANLLARIEAGHYPALLVTRDLAPRLKDIQAGLQAAAAAQDREALADVDRLRDAFLASVGQQKQNRTIAAGEIERLARAFEDYYTVARSATERMIAQKMDEDLVRALETMKAQHNALEARIQALAETSRRQADDSFRAAGAQQRSAVWISALLAIVSALAVLALSGGSRAAGALRGRRWAGRRVAGAADDACIRRRATRWVSSRCPRPHGGQARWVTGQVRTAAERWL